MVGGGAGQHDHQAASARRGGAAQKGGQAIGRSRGGWTTKLQIVAVDEYTPLILSLTPGQAGDAPEGRRLLARLGPQPGGPALLIDRAYEGDPTRRLAGSLGRLPGPAPWTGSLGWQPVAPPIRTRRDPWPYDRERYKQRNIVERLFNRLKRCRRIATRYDKLDALFLAFIYLAVICDLLQLV